MDRFQRLIREGLVIAAVTMVAWQTLAISRQITRVANHVDALAARVTVQPLAGRTPAPVERTPEIDAQIAAASHRLDAIIASGRLTPDDLRELAPRFESLPREDVFPLRRRLAHAINTRQIVPTESRFTLP